LHTLVQNWCHARPAEASVDLAYLLLPFSPRPALGKPSASATACGLEAKAFAATIRHLSEEVLATVKSLGIEPKQTSFRSPWQNGVAKRWVGSCRRDLLDHVIVPNERHLKRLMHEYVRYYHDDRTHLALAKGTPAGRKVGRNPLTRLRRVPRGECVSRAHRDVGTTCCSPTVLIPSAYSSSGPVRANRGRTRRHAEIAATAVIVVEALLIPQGLLRVHPCNSASGDRAGERCNCR